MSDGADAVTNHHGPVFHGDVKDAQLAWNNTTVIQNQAHTEQVAPGFEDVARVVADVLGRLSDLGLPAADERDAAENAHAVLAEVVRPEPDPGVIRRGLTAIKGTLAQLAAGLVAGAADGSTELARELVKSLGQLGPG
ncbi:hypothetical protein [Saccharothrix australiensis]|uniref:Uncharacterized protein n=1 Tax=Saccharothrix australiensis TaxID=2072 RepID=A0A495W355_9PSEU|nr:hypothetical protein [Saccharothrix australiensis]RKT56141.1 hypothetical protein C8E97_4830 [Saccharothrix australiensis]